jgi:hypothetical protein
MLDTTWQSIIGVIDRPHSSSDSTSHELWIGTAPQMTLSGDLGAPVIRRTAGVTID